MIKTPMYVFAVPTAPTAWSLTDDNISVSTMPESIYNNVSKHIGTDNCVSVFFSLNTNITYIVNNTLYFHIFLVEYYAEIALFLPVSVM